MVMKKTIFALCLLTSSCSPPNFNDDVVPAQSFLELKEQLEKVLIENHVPGMSLAIVDQDGQYIMAGLGEADRARGRAATADTLFRIGSVSKGFASLSILKLISEGKLSLQDTLSKWAPEIGFENPWESSDPVRIVNLLEHTTGWDDMSLHEYALNNPNINLLKAFASDPHARISRWRPGTRMAYNNYGPAAAAYIVEKISGQKFEDYVFENFFKPIGLKTATYFQPTPEAITNLYYGDGETPRDYWNLSLRPSGSINASAKDMAAYLSFYLNRGIVNGKQILPSAALERQEIAESTWAAKEGLPFGYGLSNYVSIHDGFVYHGHNGGVEGGLTDMAYIPEENIGYFYSINSGDQEAFNKIGMLIRAYITRDLNNPPLPPVVEITPDALEYRGWYEPDSPRTQAWQGFERLMGLSYVSFEDDKLIINSLDQKNALYVPVTNSQFRFVPEDGAPDPIATLSLIKPNKEGRFIQNSQRMLTLKHIRTSLAVFEIFLTVFVLLCMFSILVYAPFWIFGGLIKKRRRPGERAMRLLPLIAVLSLVIFNIMFMFNNDDLIYRLGNLSVWSILVFLATIIFAVFSILSLIVSWLRSKHEIRRGVRVYSIIVSTALVIATAYLLYWGIIGLRTWV